MGNRVCKNSDWLTLMLCVVQKAKAEVGNKLNKMQPSLKKRKKKKVTYIISVLQVKRFRSKPAAQDSKPLWEHNLLGQAQLYL